MDKELACSNVHECSCTYTDCKNHGRCCECVASHLKGGSLPLCMQQMLEKK